MRRLISLPWWIILPSSLVVVASLSLALRSLVVRIIGGGRDQAASIAAPLMPAFGVLFAFLSGFAITAMWSAHTAAESSVSMEASAATSLAWASTATGADTTRIQDALVTYLDAQIGDEWEALHQPEPQVSAASEHLQALERTVRDSAVTPPVATASASELLTALDQVASHRAERLGAAGRSMPTALFLALVFTGLALCLNALILSLSGSTRARVVSLSIIAVVAVDLAVLLILAGPFTGSQQVSDDALVSVRSQLVDGYFSR